MRNPLFCSFASFLIVSLTTFINKPDSSKGLIIFIISFNSSFEIVNFVVYEAKSKRLPDPRIFLWIAASVADAAAVNPNDIKLIVLFYATEFFITLF